MFGSKKPATSAAPVVPEVAKQKQTNVTSNGKAAPATAPAAAPGLAPMSEESRKRAAAALQLSAAFAQVVTVLMRSPQHKHLALADLEWLVFPPLTTGQFAIANVQAKEGGASMPAALVLWASVSADVDKKLSENVSGPMRLRPDEWKSGDILWLVRRTRGAGAPEAALRERPQGPPGENAYARAGRETSREHA